MKHLRGRFSSPRKKIVMLFFSIMMLLTSGFVFLYFRQAQHIPPPKEMQGCKLEHVPYDPMQPESIKNASVDQQAILSVDGLPQAFTMYIDPVSGSLIEEWDYFTTGRELIFLDGSFQGGTEVPQPKIDTNAPMPELNVYPWEIAEEFTPACVVRLTGTALFSTSALVLPGWNDGYEIARLWMLAGGGSMITVDEHLAMLSMDPGEAINLDQLSITDLLFGSLGDGDYRLGALLSPDDYKGKYRLSLSPRGQGTTKDGVEVILVLESTKLDSLYVFGKNAHASLVDIYGLEKPVQANGKVTITRQDNGYKVKIDGIINDQKYLISGTLANGLWKRSDQTVASALGESWLSDNQQSSNLQPTISTTLQPASATKQSTKSLTPSPASSGTLTEQEANTSYQLILHDTFDSNTNKWPLTYSTENEVLFFQSDIFESQYLVFAERKKGERPFVERLIDFNVNPRFQISVEMNQEGNNNSDCGLIFATKDKITKVGVFVSAGDSSFRALQNDSFTNWKEIIGWTPSSAILPNQVNRLTLSHDGVKLYVHINGQNVGAVELAGKNIQNIGLAASAGSQDPVICYFDNLKVRAE